MVWPLTTEDTSDSIYLAQNYIETMENKGPEIQNTAFSQNTGGGLIELYQNNYVFIGGTGTI